MGTLALLGNTIIALAYLSIFAHIVFRVLMHENRWRDNPLALATASIFLTCGAGHLLHAVQLFSTHGAHTKGGIGTTLAVEDLVTAGVATWYWSLRRLFPALRTQQGLFETRDIREQQERFAREVGSDPLTGLGNRRSLDDALETLPPGGIVLFVDLDHFKRWNDTYGHEAGDRLLQLFANMLRTTARETDVTVRYGGEEFVVVSPPDTDTTEMFQRMRDAWDLAGAPVTFTGGVARRLPGETPLDTLRRADRHLYQAKEAGRDRLVDDATPDLRVVVPRQETPLPSENARRARAHH
ncbi:MAG TPA: GGDEF domain-containing protein [Mycobacteriales bacterium]|nr:GGDEF domain-containing protein [Mycobacteriales bacterium]